MSCFGAGVQPLLIFIATAITAHAFNTPHTAGFTPLSAPQRPRFASSCRSRATPLQRAPPPRTSSSHLSLRMGGDDNIDFDEWYKISKSDASLSSPSSRQPQHTVGDTISLAPGTELLIKKVSKPVGGAPWEELEGVLTK
mmetsp:Transcript_11478/g.22626  ORF Transcript_11478/g.22626 Transcript_11478/m.22626 type:complete len:140 (+) Transcript_11478:41-460(+)